MPVDWEAIVAPFRAAFRSQTKYFTDSIREIAKWLKKRLESARTMEQLSRAYPVIDFTDGAVQVSIGLFQQRTLGLPQETGTPPPADEHLSAWQRFGQGLQRIPDAVEEGLAMPRLVSVIEQMLSAIVASIDRWEKPDWHMFDTRQPRGFSDLFGQLFFFAEMISLSVDPIRVVLNSEVARLLMQPSKGSPDSGDTLAQVVQYMVDALLLLPIGCMWLASLFRWGILSIKSVVLDFLMGMEDLLYTLRRRLLTSLMGGLAGMIGGALHFLETTKWLLRFALVGMTFFVHDVLSVVLGEVRTFLFTLEAFMGRIHRLFGHIIGALDGIMKVNVGSIATHGLIHATVEDLVDIVTGKSTVKYHALKLVINRLGKAGQAYDESVPGRIWPKHLKDRADAADEILETLANMPAMKIPKASLPGPASAFPDIYEYLTTKNAVDMQGSLLKLRGSLEQQLPAILDTAGDALTNMGDELAASGGNMAWIGPFKDVTNVRDFADSTTAMLFGDQEKELRGKLHSDALAAAFDLAVASGGFHIVGAAIPFYIESMREFWEQEPAADKPLPTSPHILAKRQKLGCVRLPAIRIGASGRELDDPLISRVAAEFRRAVQGAWTSGLKQVEAGV
jgi:hypothetical protein